MIQNKETELKLRVLDAGCWERIFNTAVVTGHADLSSFAQQTLETQYYDTPDCKLQKARLAFRIRRENGVWLATVKDGGSSGGGLHQRAEWTITLSEPIADVYSFKDTPVGPALAEAAGGDDLIVLFATCFERRKVDIRTPDGSIVELAADRGEISAGDATAPILEIELELKDGNEGTLLQLGADLARELSLSPEWRSKYFRALELCGFADDKLPEYAYPSLDDTEAAGAALVKLLISSIQCLLVAQDRFIRLPGDQETLHQTRVHLRRLRSLLAFGKDLLPEETYAEYKAMLLGLTEKLEPLKEIDAAVTVWQEIIAAGEVDFSIRPVLGNNLAEKRADFAGRINQELNKGQITPRLLDMWAWFANNAMADAGDTGRVLLGDFARGRLQKWLDQLLQASKDLDPQDPEKVHALRIHVKKIRYVLEALTSLWPKKAPKIIEHLKELQDSLGYLHDAHGNNRIIQGLLRAQSSRLLYRDAGILTGWQAHKCLSLRRKLKKQLKRLNRAEQVWRGIMKKASL